jgi:hypothetical protein
VSSFDAECQKTMGDLYIRSGWKLFSGVDAAAGLGGSGVRRQLNQLLAGFLDRVAQLLVRRHHVHDLVHQVVE